MIIKNEAELLNKFCDKTHIKEILTEPFFNTNYNEVWSSDGVVLIRINPKALTNEYPKKKLAFPKLESACNKKITLEAVNQALDECPKIDEEIVIQDAVECEDCNGSGYVTWEYMDIHGHNPNRAANEFVLNDDICIILMPMLSPWNEYDAAVKLVD